MRLCMRRACPAHFASDGELRGKRYIAEYHDEKKIYQEKSSSAVAAELTRKAPDICHTDRRADRCKYKAPSACEALSVLGLFHFYLTVDDFRSVRHSGAASDKIMRSEYYTAKKQKCQQIMQYLKCIILCFVTIYEYNPTQAQARRQGDAAYACTRLRMHFSQSIKHHPAAVLCVAKG